MTALAKENVHSFHRRNSHRCRSLRFGFDWYSGIHLPPTQKTEGQAFEQGTTFQPKYKQGKLTRKYLAVQFRIIVGRTYRGYIIRRFY